MNIKTNQTALDLDHIEQMLIDKGYQTICGVDEVGRGPLAGPVVAAAVIIPSSITLEGLVDSKKLSSMRREEYFDRIHRHYRQ